MKKYKNYVLTASIFMYISFVVTLLSAVLVSPLSIIDAILVLALGLWMQLSCSRVAAVITIAYGVYNLIVMIVLMGTVGGWLILVAGILAALGAFTLNKNYNTYLQTGKLPQP